MNGDCNVTSNHVFLVQTNFHNAPPPHPIPNTQGDTRFIGLDKRYQDFTYFSSVGGASVVDYLLSDPNSLCNSIFDSSIGNKQPDLDQCPLFFKTCNSAGSRL